MFGLRINRSSAIGVAVIVLGAGHRASDKRSGSEPASDRRSGAVAAAAIAITIASAITDTAAITDPTNAAPAAYMAASESTAATTTTPAAPADVSARHPVLIELVSELCCRRH